MYKKKVILLIMMALIMTGCTKIDSNIDNIVSATMTREIKNVNTVSTGYKLYIPIGVMQLVDNQYNQKLKIRDTHVYLYVDTVSYYYKNNLNFKSDSKFNYYYKELNFNDKTGYIGINKLDDGSFAVEVSENHSLYRKTDKTFQIPFKIKNIYNQNFINNIISCNFNFIDENHYQQNLEFSKSISFGFSGSEGSEYIYNIELYKTESNGQVIKIQSISNLETNFNNYSIELKAYDYNMEQITFQYTPEYKWITEDDNAYITLTQENMSQFLSRFKELEPIDRIIMARHIIGTNLNNEENSNEYLITYLPIGSLLSDTEYNLEGCKTISYDYSGTKPYYYKGEYKLYKRGSTTVEQNIYFQREYQKNLNINEDVIQIIQNKIKPYDVYIEGLTHFAIRAIKDINMASQTDLLIFPVVIIQGQYSAMTEQKKPPIKINNVDSIEKPILGYLSTNRDGIIIGKRIALNNPNVKNSIIGLYDYKSGEQLFGLDETNGLFVDGLEDNLITLKNGNLINFTLTDCTGVIEKALKLSDTTGHALSIGSSSEPVYFSNGIPVKCTSIATSSQIQELQRQIESLQRQINNLSK